MSDESLEKEAVEEQEIIEATAEEQVEDGEAPSEETEELTVEAQLENALAEAEDYKDRWMRSQAEFANARKRMERQRIETYANAKADVVLKFLPALDDFERAITNTPENISADSWYEGIQLVERKFKTLLEALNITPIEAIGELFDPNFHEAISQEPTEEYESGIVCRELQKGYQLGDRVIRPSLVIVAE